MSPSPPRHWAAVVPFVFALGSMVTHPGYAYRVVYPGQYGVLEVAFFNPSDIAWPYCGCHGARGWPSEAPFDIAYIEPGTGGIAECHYSVPDTAAVGLNVVWLLVGPEPVSMDTLAVRDWVEVRALESGEGWIAPTWRWMGDGEVPHAIGIRRVSPAGIVTSCPPVVEGLQIGARDASAPADSLFQYTVVVPVGQLLIARGAVEASWASNGAHGIHLVALERSSPTTLRIRFIAPGASDVRCEAFDPQGRRVGQQWALGAVGTVEVAMRLETSAAGVYFVRLQSRHGAVNARVTLR